MRFPHHEEFSKKQIELAEFAKCLGHPARIAIVTLLIEKEQLCCSEIVQELPLAQATVSQHLRALEKGGLLTSEADGVRVCYRLDHSRLRRFCHAFQKALGTA